MKCNRKSFCFSQINCKCLLPYIPSYLSYIPSYPTPAKKRNIPSFYSLKVRVSTYFCCGSRRWGGELNEILKNTDFFFSSHAGTLDIEIYIMSFKLYFSKLIHSLNSTEYQPKSYRQGKFHHNFGDFDCYEWGWEYEAKIRALQGNVERWMKT